MLIEAADVKDIAPGGIKGVSAGGKFIVICNYEGAFYALGGKCSHAGASLDKGSLDGYILTCPAHFAQFDITTGESLSGPVPPDPLRQTHDLILYPVKLQDDKIFIDIPSD